jgi:RNA polymerase sigma-70 factor (ECF subfamily)
MRIPDVTDAQLASRAAAGDGDAFGELIDRYAPAARRVARTVLLNPEDADDAVQDGCLSAWRAIDRYDARRPFGPWLMRIVLNAARDQRRRSRVRRTEPLPPDRAGTEATPDRATGRALFHAALAAALAELPERQRVAVTLFDAEGYPHAEIAALLGVPEGTVRSDVFQARRALRAALAPFKEEQL